VSVVTPPRVAFVGPHRTTPELRSRLQALALKGSPFLVSALVLGALWLSATLGNLPATIGTTTFLVVAVWWDVRELRIPNALTFPALAAALLWAGVSGGWGAAGGALGAALAALAVGLGPFAWGWLGAGDIKALAVLAALWGLDALLPALWWMASIGGVGAIALLAAHGELGDLLRRWGRSLWLTLSSRRLYYVSAAPGAKARAGLPFAVAMGLGCAAQGLFGAPW
jgi:prepilin peptidase CpaA